VIGAWRSLKIVSAFGRLRVAVLGERVSFSWALPSTVLVDGLARGRALRAGLLACGMFVGVALGVFLPFRLAWGPRV
jgi:hypothetical protein